MENHYALFHVALMLNVLILVVSFTGVISATMPNIIEVMKNDTNICEKSKVLYDLEYTKRCESLPYPSASLNFSEETLDSLLCLGIYDTAYKFCQYSNNPELQIPSLSMPVLPSFVKKFVVNETQQMKFCDSLQGFTSSYNKIDPLLKILVENLNKREKCQRICFSLNDALNQVCAIFAWIKKIDKEANKIEIRKDHITSDKPSITQSNETASNSKTIVEEETKKTLEVKETNKSNTNLKSDNIGKDNLKVPNLELGTEKTKSDTKKLNKIIMSETQSRESASSTFGGNKEKGNKENIFDKTEITKQPIKQTPVAKSESQDPSINSLVDIVPNKGNAEDKGEEFYKEQNTDDLKTSTLSENTQDHYDAANPEDVDDVEDTIQQSTRNQNENIQDIFEQKNLQYPNIRTEDDSHFFTYFTVVTVACIAGYIGYHNKQKILAIVLEGRRSRNNRGRRRPSTANYRKLDCTLEEAVTSQCNANVTHVIY